MADSRLDVSCSVESLVQYSSDVIVFWKGNEILRLPIMIFINDYTSSPTSISEIRWPPLERGMVFSFVGVVVFVVDLLNYKKNAV
jgi:hypothetical protein